VKSILADNALPSRNTVQRVSLPANIREIRTTDVAEGERIQTAAREQFQKWFGSSYVATAVEPMGATTDYILEPANAIAGLDLPILKET
jgi:hypothetical protein